MRNRCTRRRRAREEARAEATSRAMRCARGEGIECSLWNRRGASGKRRTDQRKLDEKKQERLKYERRTQPVRVTEAALLEARHPHIMPVLPQALLACAHCLTADEEKEVSDDVKGRVAAALKTLAVDPAVSSAVEAALQQIGPDAAQLLRRMFVFKIVPMINQAFSNAIWIPIRVNIYYFHFFCLRVFYCYITSCTHVFSLSVVNDPYII